VEEVLACHGWRAGQYELEPVAAAQKGGAYVNGVMQ